MIHQQGIKFHAIKNANVFYKQPSKSFAKSVNSRTICSSITHETSIGENFLGECQAEKRKARLATSLFPGSRESVPVAFRRMQNWCRFRARRRLYSRAPAITGIIQGGESSSFETLENFTRLYFARAIWRNVANFVIAFQSCAVSSFIFLRWPRESNMNYCVLSRRDASSLSNRGDNVPNRDRVSSQSFQWTFLNNEYKPGNLLAYCSICYRSVVYRCSMACLMSWRKIDLVVWLLWWI